MRVHGWTPSSSSANGKFHFAVLRFFEAITQAQAFPGRNKYPKLEAWSVEEGKSFFLSFGKLQDTFWKLGRAAELLEIARTKFVDLQPPSTTHEQIVSIQEAHRDFPLFLDNVLIYLRIFADCLANLTSRLYGRRKDIPFFSFRDQKKWFIEKRTAVDPQYAEILKDQTTWFATLAGDSDEYGLRDIVVHRMARTQIFYKPGKVPDENQVAAFLYDDVGPMVGDLLPKIETLVDELCIFLDSYFDHFSKKVQAQLGGQLPESGTVLFEFQGRLRSAWLYPQLQ
jgi:hypothetical protein